MWHPLGCLHSEQWVQQGDPLGPLLFSLVLNILMSEITSSGVWYLDDGVLTGPRSAVLRALSIIQGSLGLINIPNCENFSNSDLSSFPPAMKRSSSPNVVILGIPIGDQAFCSVFISDKHQEAKALLLQLEEVGSVDLHVAFTLLRQCAGFC